MRWIATAGVIAGGWLAMGPAVATARPVVLFAPASLSAGTSGSVWADAGDAARYCEVRATRNRVVQGPYRARIGGPIVIARWRIPAGARSATWKVALRCAPTRSGLRSASALTTKHVRVLGKRSGRALLAAGGVHFSARARNEVGGAREPAFSGVPGAQGSCANADNGYKSTLDALGYCTGYSTAYVASRWGISLKGWGPAANWYREAVRRGFDAGVPKPGAVAWWAPTKRNPAGHVAYVERVEGDKVFITEADRYAWNHMTSRALPADGPQPTLYILGGWPPPSPILPTWTGSATPALVQRPDGENVVAAIAPDGSLSVYANAAGTRTWTGTILAAAGNAAYAPAAALLPSGELRLATTGFTGSVLLWSQASPTSAWTARSVTEKNARWDRGPLLVPRPSGKTDMILSRARGAMVLFKEYASGIAGDGATTGTPAAVARPDGGTDVVAVGFDGALAFYSSKDNPGPLYPGDPDLIWTRTEIAGPGGARGGPAMVRRADGETHVAAIAPDGTLMLYVNPAGTTKWNPQRIAGPGAAIGAPALLARPDGETDVVVIAPDGSMSMYARFGGAWSSTRIAGPGSAVGSPAAVRRPNGETDVVAIGPDAKMTLYSNASGSTTWDALPIKQS